MTTAAPQIMEPDTAYAVVHNRVYAPAFFEKLAADYNIRPQTEQDAMTMLTMAGQLRTAHEAHGKQAAAKKNPLAAAAAHLDRAMTKLGFASQRTANVANTVKQAAAQASFDPELANAVLSMQALASSAA